MKCHFSSLIFAMSIMFFLVSPSHVYSDTNVSGAITSDTTWTLANSPYVVTGTIYVNSSARLTIEPGVTVRFDANTALWIAHPSSDNSAYRGSLTAVGTSDAKITFTASSGSSGGWQGILFGPSSGDFSSSSMQHCVVEKAGETNNLGTSANIHLYSTGSSLSFDQLEIKESSGNGYAAGHSDVNLSNSILSQNSGDGLYAESSSLALTGNTADGNGGRGYNISTSNGTITGCTISNNSGYGLYLSDSSPVVSDSTISGNGDYAVFYNIGSSIPDIYNNTFSGNTNPGIQVSGGSIPENHTFYAQTGEPYYTITDSPLSVMSSRTLTIEPGVTVRFDANTALWITHPSSDNSSYRGSLTAQGTSDAKIIFTALSGSSGGWQGIIFGPSSDDNSSSSMQHCVVEKAGETNNLGVSANIHLNYTGNVSGFSFNHIIISSSSGNGVVCDFSYLTISDAIIVNNVNVGIDGNDSSLSISRSYIANNDQGLNIDDSIFSVMSSNVISENITYGMYTAPSVTVNAENIYWGDATGPYDGSDDSLTGGFYNPDGKGCQVSDFIDYVPWTGSVTDSDKDGLPNFVEVLAGTDPNDADTDNDGVPDAEEIQSGIFPSGPYEDDSTDQVTSGSGGGGGGGCFISSFSIL